MNDTESTLIPLFRVLILSTPDDPAELTSKLMSHLELNKIDARILQHNLPGLIPNPLTAEKAEALCGAVHEVEGYGISISAEEIPDLSQPTRPHHLACSDEGLAIYNLQGEVDSIILPEDLELLSIGALPTEKAHHEVENQTLLHTSSGPRTTQIDLPTMMGAEAYLIAKNPFRVFLINHNEMNYEYLDDRKASSATTNFKLFTDDLIAMARELYMTPASRAFTNHGLLNHYRFDSPESLSLIHI